MRRIEVAEFGSEAVLRLVDFMAPTLGPGDVEVQLHAAGVNPADTYLRAGNYEFLEPTFPFTPGFDGSGVVARVGEEVASVQTGDRVWVCTIPGRTLGTYAESLVCDATLVHPLPAGLSFTQGAALGIPYATAHRALFQRGGAKPGETLLVHGASGGVGLPTVQLARAHGMTVIGSAGTKSGRESVRAAGAHHVLDHRAPGYLDAIWTLTDGRGLDVVVEMVAGSNLQRDLELLARGGRVVIVGARTPIEIAPRRLMVAEADIRGTALWNMSADDFTEAYDALQALLECGGLSPIVGATLPLEEAAIAHKLIQDGKGAGKVVLVTQLGR